MCLRIAAGIAVTPDTIAADLIKEIGPQGETYLTADHTLARLRSEEYLTPRVSVRGPLAAWQMEGARNTYELAREKAKELAKVSPPPLSQDRRAKLEQIISNFRQRC